MNWRWNSDDEPELVGIQKWYFGKYRWDWMNSEPKYTGGNDDGVKPVVLRYAYLQHPVLGNPPQTGGLRVDDQNHFLHLLLCRKGLTSRRSPDG